MFAAKSYAEWERLLFAARAFPFGVVGRVWPTWSTTSRRQHAGIFGETTNPEVPRTVNNPDPPGLRQAARVGASRLAVGEHCEEILRELAYSDADIAVLRKAGALG